MAQTFEIVPPGRMAVGSLVAVAAICILLGLVVATGLPLPTLAAWLVAAPCFLIAVLFAWFALKQRQSSVTISDRRIDIDLPLYGRSLAIDKIVDGSVAKVSLPRDEKFQLEWRTNGLGVPGYQLGWFRTRGAGKVLAAITGADLVSWRTTDGYSVLLSVTQPDAFLKALHEASSK